MRVATKTPSQADAAELFDDRVQRDSTIYAMVIAGGKTPAAVADHFNLTIGDVRRIVRRVRDQARRAQRQMGGK